MNEKERNKNATRPEFTIYIYTEGEQEICKLFPPTTTKPFRTVKKGLPHGFYILDTEKEGKVLYSEDVIIPLKKGQTQDIIMRNGEPCIIDSDGNPHYFLKPFQEFKEELLAAAREKYRKKDYWFYYKDEKLPDGTKYETNTMIACISRGRKREYVNADEMYDMYQYGVSAGDLLDALEEEVKSEFLACMQYMTDPKDVWEYYKEMIIPEMWDPRDYRFCMPMYVTMAGEGYNVQFVCENRKDITGYSSFYITPEHMKKMGVDLDTLYDQSVKNLRKRLEEQPIDQEEENGPLSEELNALRKDKYIESCGGFFGDYPGTYFVEEYGRRPVSGEYMSGTLLLPEVKERLNKIYPEGYCVTVRGCECVAYPKNLTFGEGKYEEYQEYINRGFWSRPPEPEKKEKPQKGVLEGLFSKKKLKLNII